MKVLLMAVCSDGMRDTLEEIGICYIASYLRKNGIEVMLHQKREEDINYKKITQFKPDVIGLTIYEKSRMAVYRISHILREKYADNLIVAGGPFATYCHQELLQEAPDIDCVIRGEGEITFYELVERYQKQESFAGLPGLTYRKGNELVINEPRELMKDLNDLPWPARDLLLESGSKVAIISTSRGCLANCSFCANQLFWKKWRGRSAKNVVDEIEYIVNTYGIRVFNFADASIEDPNFDRLQEMAEEIIKRKLDIAFLADFRAEFHRKASVELVELLVEAGLCGVCIGIEAANNEDLKVYRKIAKTEDNVISTEIFKKYNINILPGFIMFNPYSTIDGLRKNIQFLEKYEFAASMEIVINQYRMYKGGYLQKRLEKEGLLENKEYSYKELGYHFKDSRIENLTNFMHGYVEEIHKEIPFAFDRITDQLELFTCFVYQLKRRLKKENNEKVNQIFERYDQQFKDLKVELNHAIAKWFQGLLDLAEHGWSQEKAWKIAQETLSKDYVEKMLKEFIKNSGRLQMNLLRVNRKYGDELFQVR